MEAVPVVRAKIAEAAPTAEPIAAIDSERALLGGLLLDPSIAWPQVRDAFAPKIFYRQQHRDIAAAIQALISAGDPVDLITVNGKLKGRVEAGALQELVDGAPTASTAGYHVRLVAEKAWRREADLIASDVRDACRNGADPGPLLEKLAKLPRPGTDSNPYIGAAISCAELMAMTFPAANSLVGDGLLSIGDYSIMVGAKGAGKSWLSLQLAADVARGLPFFGHHCARSRALVLSLELSREKLQGRMREIAPDTEDLYLFGKDSMASSRVSPIPKLGREEYQRWVLGEASRIEPALIVIDPLGPAVEADENAELPAIARFLLELAAKTRSHVHVTHHPRKSAPGGPADNGVHAMRGPSQLTDWAACCWTLKAARGAFVLTHAAEPRHCPTPPDVWLERTAGGPFEMIDQPEDAAARAENRQQVLLEALEERGSISVSDAMRICGVTTRATAGKYLDAIGAVQVGRGAASRWHLRSSTQQTMNDD